LNQINMQSYLSYADRLERAADAVLGTQPGAQQIRRWCEQFRNQCQDIEESRGLNLPSIAIIGAKGQGKTWIAKQWILDPLVAGRLPSGVLSREATTQLYWIGPQPPENLDPAREIYLPCRREMMLDLQSAFILLDTPGVTDDDKQAAKLAREAMSLSPIQLLVVRRDQLRGAVLGSLAHNAEGSICIPVITCVPTKDWTPSDQGPHSQEASIRTSSSLQADLEMFERSLRSFAPSTRFLSPILVEDFEASGDEPGCGARFRFAIQHRLQSESFEGIAATKASRLEAARERLKGRVRQYVQSDLQGLLSAVQTLHREADSLPAQTLETVLGSQEELQAAIRGRLRAHVLSDTALIWFPYRTILSLLGYTTGAWDRLVLSLTGSVPSIFGTFLAWAKNVSQSRSIQWELQQGIRERLNRQMEDRLQPVQDSFYRSVYRLKGEQPKENEANAGLHVRLTGIDELQDQARTVFEWSVDRELPAAWRLQFFGLVGTLLFWGMMAGPIVAVYRRYFEASWRSLMESNTAVDGFEFGSGIFLSSVLLSVLPLLVYCMVVLSWWQRHSKVRRLATRTLAEEHRLLEDLRAKGVIRLRYEDPLLEHAEFLVHQ
jgi:hypothetical protein